LLELYHHSESVCAQKVRLALAEKEIEWKSHYVYLEKGEQRTPEFKKINPKGVVPVLIHDEKNIPESTVICEYLDECFDGPKLMPENPYWRSKKRLWSKMVDEGLHYPNTMLISFIIAFRHMSLAHIDTPEKIAEHLNKIENPKLHTVYDQILNHGTDSPVFEEAIRFYDTVLADMEKTLTKQSWLAGSDFSLADITLAPYVHRLSDLQLLVMCEKRPAVLDWYSRIKARSSWQTAVVDWNDQWYLDGMHKHGLQAQATVEGIWRGITI
jgi:glutathione S-transferase